MQELTQGQSLTFLRDRFVSVLLIIWVSLMKSKNQLKKMGLLQVFTRKCGTHSNSSHLNAYTVWSLGNTMKKSLTCTFLLMACINLCSGSLLAYDCAHQFANRTKINMLSSAPCNIKSSSETVQSKMIYLVQPKEYFTVHVKSCKVSVVRDINDCSTFSDNRVIGGLLSYIHDVSSEECRNMHRFMNTKFNNIVISGLKRNGTLSTSLVLAGKIYQHNGGCKGGVWSENGVTWEDVYVSASVSITLKDYWAEASTNGEVVKLQSGYECKLSEQNCIDPENGFTIWEDDYKDNTCENDNYELVYKGFSNKTTINIENEESVLYSVSNDIAFSLLIKTKTFVCGHEAYQTEHPKLKIIEHNGFELQFKKSDDPFNLNLFTYINSKFTFLERHTKSQLTSLHKALLLNQCELDRTILDTQLALAFISPADFAYLRMGKPGYTALPAGEVMYLVKCQAVSVNRKFLDECYQEFPVEYKNSTWFMSPRTHLLTKNGNQIPCSEIVPVNYNVEGKWYSFSPKIHETLTPTSVVPKSDLGWKYSDPVPLINTGLYSAEDLENMRKQLMFPMDKGAVISEISSRVQTRSNFLGNSEYDFSKLINEDDIKSSVEGFFLKTTGFLFTFGSYTSIIIGFWMTYHMVKWIADLIFHLVTLYKEYGLNYHITAAAWDTLSNHLKNKAKYKKTKDNHEGIRSELKDKINEHSSNLNQEMKEFRKEMDQTRKSHTCFNMVHTRYHFENQKFEHCVCVKSKSDVTEVDGGILIKTPTSEIQRRGFTIIGIYDCTCVISLYLERTIKYYGNFMNVNSENFIWVEKEETSEDLRKNRKLPIFPVN